MPRLMDFKHLIPVVLIAMFVVADVSACGDEDRTQTEFTASIDKTSTSADDTAALIKPSSSK